MTANVSTVNSPASCTESGFVPPGLKVKENYAPPLAKLPEVPKGLVRVRTWPATVQLVTEESITPV